MSKPPILRRPSAPARQPEQAPPPPGRSSRAKAAAQTRAAQTKSLSAEWLKPEHDHLDVLANYERATVRQFRENARVPDARRVLDGYVKQGYVQRQQVGSAGMYSLTAEGVEHLADLKRRLEGT